MEPALYLRSNAYDGVPSILPIPPSLRSSNALQPRQTFVGFRRTGSHAQRLQARIDWCTGLTTGSFLAILHSIFSPVAIRLFNQPGCMYSNLSAKEMHL